MIFDEITTYLSRNVAVFAPTTPKQIKFQTVFEGTTAAFHCSSKRLSVAAILVWTRSSGRETNLEKRLESCNSQSNAGSQTSTAFLHVRGLGALAHLNVR